MQTQFNFKLPEELLSRAREKAGYRPVSDILRELLSKWVEEDFGPGKAITIPAPEVESSNTWTSREETRIEKTIPKVTTKDLSKEELEEKQESAKKRVGKISKVVKPKFGCLGEMAHEAKTCGCYK